MNDDMRAVADMTADEKRALLARLLQDSAGPAMSNLSVEQQRLWFLHKLDPTVPWHLAAGVRVTGEFDLSAFQQALSRVMQRHESLRSTFVEVNGQPFRGAAPASGFPVSVVEWDGGPLRDVVSTVVGGGFDLGTGPLLRVAVARRDADECVVLVVMHPMVGDRTSLEAFVAEVFGVYGGQPADASVDVGFAEVGTQQRDWLAGEEAARETAFWRDRLGGVPAYEFPSDRPRPATKSFRGTGCGVDVAGDLVAGVTGLAAELGVEPSVVWLAGWGLVLARSAGAADFAVGVPVPGWRDAGTQDVVGPLGNVVPVRLGYEGAMSFPEWVGAVGRWWAEARSHGRVPFDRIVEAVAPGRDLSRWPLYQVSFEAATESARIGAGGVVAEPVPLDTGFATVDLELVATVTEGADSWRLRLDGNADMFDGDTLRGLLDRLRTVVAAGVADPARPVSRLPLLEPAERQRVLVDWNGSGVDVPDRCLHELVEAQVIATPERTAVVCGDQELTYRQLNDRANQLAATLRHVGVGPESRVGVLVDRSVDAVVALLGVLKSGGGYVPLDATHPAQRLEFMATDAGVVAVVGTEARKAEAANAVPRAEFVAIPMIEDGTPNPARTAAPRNLAYIIYTSGTTGQPKGVAVTHRQITASTSARWTYPAVDAQERFLVMAPLTFDAGGGFLYGTLTRGGTVVMPTQTEVQDPRALSALLRSAEVTHFSGVPSQYSVLMETDATEAPSLRQCVLAGEPLPPALVAAHFERTPGVALYNEYGPTEGAVWASVCDVRPQHTAAVSVPIGHPIRNARIYLLDAHLSPVPPGTPADLYIGGETVARGYLNQPALTAERFIPDPYGAPGQRLYRTGDRARYLPDGSIEFLGRVDQQVKIRGFRIELSEIENVILRHPHITEAAVTVAYAAGNPRLVAHVVPEQGRVVTQQELSAHVVTYVPDYMVPAAFVTLERMPLTPHGKIDRDALPSPELVAAEGRREPETATEAAVAEAWCEVLGVASVGTDIGFFDLGGNSLQVARLVARLARQFDVELPVEEIFRVPTVAGIAAAIDLHQLRKAGKLDNDAMYAMELAELRSEATLDPSIRPDGLPVADYLNPRHVLVTGGTGYIGAFLISELIRTTEATVHCLVRGDGPEAAAARLEDVMRGFSEWDESYRARIRVVVGDLAKPKVGLSAAAFDELGETIDAIYHPGAVVNFALPYDAMKPANVGGTEELLRLACHRKVKAFHHVSSMDVYIGARMDRPWLEEDITAPPVAIPQGYPRSKWVAEKLAILARDRGVPTCIYRPWIVVGHTKTGASHTTDYMFVGLKGYLQLGFIPLWAELLNAIPVDYFCAAMVRISLRQESFGKFFNIGNLQAVAFPTIYSWMASFGYSPTLVEEKEGEQRTVLEAGEDNPLFPLTPMIRANRPATVALHAEIHEKIDPTTECRNVLDALEGTGIVCPTWTEEMAHACLRYLVAIGFLPPPSEVAVGQPA